jgi:hypothetical protein
MSGLEFNLIQSSGYDRKKNYRIVIIPLCETPLSDRDTPVWPIHRVSGCVSFSIVVTRSLRGIFPSSSSSS